MPSITVWSHMSMKRQQLFQILYKTLSPHKQEHMMRSFLLQREEEQHVPARNFESARQNLPPVLK